MNYISTNRIPKKLDSLQWWNSLIKNKNKNKIKWGKSQAQGPTPSPKLGAILLSQKKLCHFRLRESQAHIFILEKDCSPTPYQDMWNLDLLALSSKPVKDFVHKVPTILPIGKRFSQQIGYVLVSLDISRAPFITGTAFTDEMEAYRLRFLLDGWTRIVSVSQHRLVITKHERRHIHRNAHHA